LRLVLVCDRCGAVLREMAVLEYRPRARHHISLVQPAAGESGLEKNGVATPRRAGRPRPQR